MVTTAGGVTQTVCVANAANVMVLVEIIVAVVETVVVVIALKVMIFVVDVVAV